MIEPTAISLPQVAPAEFLIIAPPIIRWLKEKGLDFYFPTLLPDYRSLFM
jgi:hypothetical protein